MENAYIVREKTSAENRYNAGSKAREDVDAIVTGMGAEPINCIFDFTDNRTSSNRIQKLLYHFKTASAWKRQLKSIEPNSTVIFQFPVKAHTILFSSVLASLKKRHIKTIAIVHDLDTLRNAMFYGSTHGYRIKQEEINALKQYDCVIAHNEKMIHSLTEKFGVDRNRLISLEIFDYLIPEGIVKPSETDISQRNSIIIAGNLDRDKCGYAYALPKEPAFELYGANYGGDYADNVHYNGKFHPDELPAHLHGGFGLVWDGDQTTGCTGIFGEYLKINNPHKVSLYLACGIPVIIWEEAAISSFVKKNNCGIVVKSIESIAEVLSGISEEEYKQMKQNAMQTGKKLREGFYTKKAIKTCTEI